MTHVVFVYRKEEARGAGGGSEARGPRGGSAGSAGRVGFVGGGRGRRDSQVRMLAIVEISDSAFGWWSDSRLGLRWTPSVVRERGS